MNNIEDLRITKTKLALTNSLLELMESVGFEKISVQMLTKHAMVSRTTFYLHYLDKYDLLDKTEDEMLAKLQSIVFPFISSIKEHGDFSKIPKLIIEPLYSFIAEHKDFFTLIFSDKGDPAFLNKFYETIKNTMMTFFEEKNFTIPSHYAISTIVSIQVSLIKEWLNSGMVESPAELADMVALLLSDVPSKLLRI